MKTRYNWWIVVAIIFIAGIYAVHIIVEESGEIEFFITVVGTSFSILGIAISLDQIHKTKSKTEETRAAVEDAKNRMQIITKAFSITDGKRLAEVTEGYLRNRSLGESLIKLQEFSQILIDINDEELKQNHPQISQKITRQMQLIKRDISSLNRTNAEIWNISWDTIIAHVEDAKNTLSEHFSLVNKSI